MTKTLKEVQRFLENHTLAWHHWLMILALLKLGGSATKKQIFPVYQKEGFSPHAIHDVFRGDLIALGEAVHVEGELDTLDDTTMIYLTEDPKFRAFIKKNLKSVVRTLKMRKPQ